MSEKDILEKIEELNKNDEISGILVQLPLPSQISKEKIINAINPSKDVDGFNPINVGNLSSGYDSIVPCTPLGCLLLIKKGWVKKNTIVIDVGINKVGEKIVGDVNFEELKDNVKAITPVPGGVGPMTIACLLKNTLACFNARLT